MPLPPPNYTQVPNALFALMPQMKEAELRVTMAICRQTFGYHKEVDKLSIGQLEAKTGLSRQGTINGLHAGIERGTIVRQVDGKGYLYALNLTHEPANEVDSKPGVQPGSQLSGLGVVNEVDQQVVNEVDPQKKEVKEKERNDSGGGSAARTFENRPNAFAIYEQEIGVLTKNVADLLVDDLNTYPSEWVEDAIREASRNNVRKLSYVEGILKKWKADGRGAGKPQAQHRNGNGTVLPAIVNTHKWDNYTGNGKPLTQEEIESITF